MRAAERVYYKLEFAITNNEEIPSVSARTKKVVEKMIEEKKKRNKEMLLHKMGYTEEQYKSWDNTLDKMAELLKTL